MVVRVDLLVAVEMGLLVEQEILQLKLQLKEQMVEMDQLG
tara:strand:+ start:213 stop:332 length:120 start_codon:yes stop_codon:yes gene_type:complete